MTSSSHIAGSATPVNTDMFTLPSLTQDELDAHERDWLEYYAGEMLASEAKWDGQGLAFYWLDPQPGYVRSIDWDAFIPEPKAPGRREFRFTLIGGGQICAIENWHWHVDLRGVNLFLTNYPGPSLRVTAHIGDAVHRYRGEVESGAGPGEMSAEAVVFPHSVPQIIAERVGRTLAAIDATPDNFYALLDGTTSCAICNRPLRDEVSQLIGVGPNCARSLNIPHSMAAAGRRLALRKQLLAGSHTPPSLVGVRSPGKPAASKV
jgi:hypothetical protein